MYKYLILCLSLVGCGEIVQIKNVNVPATIKPYAAAFESRHGEVKGIEWKFVELPGETVGRCTLPDGLIELDAEYWIEATDAQREETVTHELGHCVLYRAHDNALDANGLPVSIMNAYLIDENIYAPKKEYYLTELFNLSNVPMIGVAEKIVWEN